ncbi:MAG: tripartite tricarboxylate transporter permease [Candidatus Woesearchaeota archaeon]
MFIQTLLAILIGVTAGTFTGLIPGIHINLISNLLLASLGVLSKVHPLALACFIIAMSTTHSFLDVIPSTYLGAPDASNALIALPAHRMLIEGRGYEAIRLTVIGSFGGLVVTALISPFAYVGIQKIYPYLEQYMFIILLSVISFIILKDKRRFIIIPFFLFSGVLGYVALNLPLIKDPLFPLLSGLFGLSILIKSFNDNTSIPEQNLEYEIVPKTKSIMGGFIAGGLTSFLPGLGASQGAAIASSLFKTTQKGFLILIGGINTVNFVLSIVAFLAIQRARNGSILAVTQIIEFSLFSVIVFILVTLISGALASFLALKIAVIFGSIMQKVSYKKTISSVIGLILVTTLILSNMYGMILLIASTALGLLATEKNVPKNCLMGCLLLPVLIYFA